MPHRYNSYVLIVTSLVGFLGLITNHHNNPVIAFCIGYSLGSALTLAVKSLLVGTNT